MTSGISGRADLVEALRAGDQYLLHATAELLGFQSQRRASSAAASNHAETAELGSLQKVRKLAAAEQWTQFQPVAIPYWKQVHYADFGEQKTAPPTRSTTRQDDDSPWRNRPLKVPAVRPLATRREVLTALRKASGRRSASFEPDIPELTDRISCGQLVDRIPMKRVRSWGASLHVIRDHSRRLTPFWSDQDFVCEVLKQIFPEYSLTISYLLDGDRTPTVIWPESRTGAWRPPPESTGVLVLGDLGCLVADEGGRAITQRFWLDLGQSLKEVGNRAMAMVPCRITEFPDSLAQFWIPVGWEHAPVGHWPDDPLRTLLTLSTRAVRLEPGLLREIRRLMPGGYGRPELEAYVWQHESISSKHPEGAEFDSDQIQPFRDISTECSRPQTRAAVDALIRDWHSNLDETVWFVELLALDHESRLLFAEDVEDAIHRFLEIAALVTEGGTAFDNWDAFVANARDFLKRIPADLWHDPEIGEAIHRIHEAVRVEKDNEVSSGMQPRLIDAGKKEELTLQIRHEDSQFVITSAAGDGLGGGTGSWVGAIRTKNRQLKVSFEEPVAPLGARVVEELDPFWLAGRPPAWAHKWDRDEYGLWCSFLVGTVQQVLRWVPAGSFLMGSPDDEEGRYPDEGPRHQVTITNGFWMFETPCTQALWDAVMDENRSQFKGPNRPVERVSWQDSREFIERLNKRLPGLELRLPTEAQWEFACRAGNQAPRYGEATDIAWFSENSESATHDVKLKTPNALGLHDILGNVYEWCLDHWPNRYDAEPQTDPLFETEDAVADRVFRGGSWYNSAQIVRAAFRYSRHPDDRDDDVGFRCLSSSEQSRPREQPRSGRNFSPPRKARQLTWQDEMPELRIEIPATAWLNIESDQEIISFRRDRAPNWAIRSGRDLFGLWAEFEYRSAVQRLRWIPPGRFLMGSEAEPDYAWIKETPQHAVTIPHGFWIFDSPCTQELFTAVLEKNESEFRGPQRPVEQVTWNDCQAFIGRLNQEFPRLNLVLPSEAQWEYCCRAGSGAERYGEIDAIAWHEKNSKKETHDVKKLAPNAWGLFDMLGNVWEWCLDEPREYAAPLPTERARSADADRVIRGGGWYDSARLVRAASRRSRHPDGRDNYVGFRCLSSSEPSHAREVVVSGSASQRSGASQTATSEPPRSGEKKSGAWDRIRKLFGGPGETESDPEA